MDGIVISSLIHELKQNILHGNINKIYQPEKDELILEIGRKKFFISANANCARAYLAQEVKKNQQTAPMFCMVLRKHILHGQIKNISQPNFDRIINLGIETSNDFGDKFVYTLVIELMGKYSNIILLNAKDTIIDSIKHIPAEKSSVRQILPNLKYQFPPCKDKVDPRTISDADFLFLVHSHEPLHKKLNGISSFISEEVIWRCENGFLPQQIKNDLANGNYINEIIFDENNKPLYLSAVDIKKDFNERNSTGIKKVKYDSISEAIDLFFQDKAQFDNIRQKTSDLHKIITNAISRCEKKSLLLDRTLADTKNKFELKLHAELIMANSFQIPKGSASFIARNYYDNDAEVEIKLDSNLSPIENAQKLFKKYNRLKRTEVATIEQIKKNDEEKSYLESVLQNLSLCQDNDDIEQIRVELCEQKIIRKRMRPDKSVKSMPLHFVSSDGFDIYVGKNNTQNDYLTLKFARPNDLWLHVKDFPGAHVVIRRADKQEIPSKTLLEAANICANFSKAKDSGNVAVDYTYKKFVKKIPGAKPGMVIYENFKTIYVTPDKNLISTN